MAHPKKSRYKTHSGGGRVSTNPFTHEVFGSSRVSTKHEHYTTFDIGNATFRCYGEYPFSDGDKVVLYASRTNKGYYEVENLKNFTRNYFIKRPAIGFKEIMASFISFGIIGVYVEAYVMSREFLELLDVGVGTFGGLAIGFLFYMFTLRKIRKKFAAFNKEITNYPEFK